MSAAAHLTGAQKCAILILLLEEAQAAELLRRLEAPEVRAVGEAMLTVAEIDPAAIDAVLDEFLARTQRVAALDAQGRQVRARIGRALGQPRAARMIDDIGPPAAPRRFAMLDWIDTPTIATLLADEHPQAVTLVLAHLPEVQAAAVLDSLAEAVRVDVVPRLATLKPVQAEVIADLEADLEAKLSTQTAPVNDNALAGTDFTARLVKLSANRKLLLDALASVDQALADDVAAQQFVFADIMALGPKDMQLVLREADPALLSVALKGAEADILDRVFAAMSSRAASQLQDELAERGPMKRSEVEAARAELCAVVRRLGEAGSIMMPGAAGAYV
jgi:flagellar motor switch protein FliG